MNAFWASENFGAFTASAPDPSREFSAESFSYERSSFWGSEHDHLKLGGAPLTALHAFSMLHSHDLHVSSFLLYIQHGDACVGGDFYIAELLKEGFRATELLDLWC